MACAVGRSSTSRRDTVDIRTVLQALAPSIEDGNHAELCTEMLGVGSDGGKRLRRAAEQDRMYRWLVLEGTLSLAAAGEAKTTWTYDAGTTSSCRLGKPLRVRRALALRTMPIRQVNGDAQLPAVWADPVMRGWRRLDRVFCLPPPIRLTITKHVHPRACDAFGSCGSFGAKYQLLVATTGHS